MCRGFGLQPHPHKFYKPTLGSKYVRNGLYNLWRELNVVGCTKLHWAPVSAKLIHVHVSCLQTKQKAILLGPSKSNIRDVGMTSVNSSIRSCPKYSVLKAMTSTQCSKSRDLPAKIEWIIWRFFCKIGCQRSRSNLKFCKSHVPLSLTQYLQISSHNPPCSFVRLYWRRCPVSWNNHVRGDCSIA